MDVRNARECKESRAWGAKAEGLAIAQRKRRGGLCRTNYVAAERQERVSDRSHDFEVREEIHESGRATRKLLVCERQTEFIA